MSDRKYRHRGYKDSESERTERRPAGPRPTREGPRGRGLGAPTATVFRCRECGRRQELMGPIGSLASCAGCGADLHACVNCLHFDPSRPKECRKDPPERVANKSKGNECALFAPRTVQEFASEGETSSARKDDPRAAFDALFKK